MIALGRRRSFQRRALPPLALIVAMGVLGAGCDGGTAGTPRTQLAVEQTLRFPVKGDIGTLDPAKINAKKDVEIARNLFDGLLKFDDKLNVVPDIATHLPEISPDGTTYEFHLNPNARFWNGDPVTAQDFVYSFSRAAAEGQNAYGVNFDHVVGYDVVSADTNWATDKKMLSGMSAPDDHTLVVKLVSPWSAFNTELALPAAAQVVDPRIVSQNDADWWSSPGTLIGTGPYKMVVRIPEQSMEFTAVDSWWGAPRPTVKSVHLDVLGDVAQSVLKYRQGGYDLIGYGGMDSNIPTPEVLRIQHDPRVSAQLKFVNQAHTIWVRYSFIHPESPFKGDLESGPAHDLRTALTLAIDRTQLVNLACAGGITCSAATGGLVTKGLKGYAGDNTDPLAKFDPSTARVLLKRGDPTGAKTANLTYYFDTNKPIYRATAESIQSQWQRNLGIHVDVQPTSHAAFVNQSVAHAYVLFREGWQADYDHPQDWFDHLFVEGGGSNGGGYTDPKVEDLVRRADTEPLDQAIPAYVAASKQMETDAAYAPLVYLKGAFLFKPYLFGAGSNNFNDYDWNEIKILSH